MQFNQQYFSKLIFPYLFPTSEYFHNSEKFPKIEVLPLYELSRVNLLF